MATVDYRLIHAQSPLQVLFIEPVREGFYSIYHGAKDFYAIYQRCVANRCFPKSAEFAWGAIHILTGTSLLVPLINAVVFQIFVSVAGSYREGLRDAAKNGDVETAKFYLSLGVTPNNVYDTKALIFQSKEEEILQALIDAGADLSRTYSGKTFLEYLIDQGMEDLAEKHFNQLSSKTMYANAIGEENWPVAAFLVRMGEASLSGREKIKTAPKTRNPLEPLVINGDAIELTALSKKDGLTAIKGWVQELRKKFPQMKVDWIWTAILSVYCESQENVNDETIYELFNYGVFRGGENPLGFNKSGFIYWAGIHGREELVDRLTRERLLKLDSSDFKELLEHPRENHQNFFDFAIRLGYHATPDEVRQNRYQCKSKNPLEGIVATQNRAGLENFVKKHSFEKFYQVYLKLKTLFPNMHTGWMWNVIYEIPQSHFDQFTPMQQSVAITSFPPGRYPLSDLLEIYNQINFDDPKKDHFIEQGALLETLDAVKPALRTPSDIEEGLRNIIEALEEGFQVYQLEPKEVEGYRLQVQWIIHLLKMDLKKGPLPRDKANVLIDMGKACLMCPGRYNDIFDAAIRRLKNERVPVISFEDQVQRYFADLRSIILVRVAEKIAKSCVHSWENLVYHLHAERALQEPKPHGLSSSQMHDSTVPEAYHFIFKSDAKEKFDAEYTPDELMGVLSEFARVDQRRSQEGNDFNELMMDAMIDAYSPYFPAIQDLERRMKERVSQRILFEDQVLPLEEVEALFKPIDPEYTIPKAAEPSTLAKHFADFKRAYLGPQIRPLTEDMMGYALPEVIHPLVMGKVLCDLGHLKQRITFAQGA